MTLLTGAIGAAIRERFQGVMQRKAQANGDLAANRACVEAMLGLEVWAHSIHEALHAEPDEHGHTHGH